MATVNLSDAWLRADPMVRKLVDNLTANLQTITELTTERVIRDTGHMAFFDKHKLFRPDGTEKHPTEWDDDTAAAISHITATGPVPFDKNEALEKAFKHQGLYEHNDAQHREDRRIIVELMG